MVHLIHVSAMLIALPSGDSIGNMCVKNYLELLTGQIRRPIEPFDLVGA